nr:hypothetical protein [uncultured Niameybacter sp.]
MEGLLILFVVLTVAVGLGTTFLFLAKNPKTEKALFYFVVFLGLGIAGLEATSLPTNYVGQIVLAWSVGFLSIIGLIAWVKKYKQPAKWLVTISAVGSLIQLFIL